MNTTQNLDSREWIALSDALIAWRLLLAARLGTPEQHAQASGMSVDQWTAEIECRSFHDAGLPYQPTRIEYEYAYRAMESIAPF